MVVPSLGKQEQAFIQVSHTKMELPWCGQHVGGAGRRGRGSQDENRAL